MPPPIPFSRCTETCYSGTGRLLSVRPHERLPRERKEWIGSPKDLWQHPRADEQGHHSTGLHWRVERVYFKLKGDHYRDLAAEFSTSGAENKADDVTDK